MHVVVVAYGSRAVTRRAVGRVRSWGTLASTISVVPASAASDVDPATFDAVQVSTARGTAGVIELAGNAPVLVLHDDIRIDAAGARDLVAGLESADLVCGTSRGSEFGFACFAVTSLGSIDSSIVIPGAKPAGGERTVALVELKAKHDHTCCAQLVPDALDPEQPLLVASMIVKDEEQHLPDALASLRGLVDRIDICDTGSVDRTMDVIRSYGGNVRQIEWRNDFAWARNQALRMSDDASFALILDADERIVAADPAAFRRWLRTWSHELDAVSIKLANERDDGPGSEIDAFRITRPATSRFEGALHETLRFHDSSGPGPARIVANASLSITHLGYRSDVVAGRDKHNRNIDIARAAHDADPSPKTAIDLARSLLAVDSGSDEAARLFDEVGEQLEPTTRATTFSYIYASRAQNAHQRGDHERAIEFARCALERTPNEDIALAAAAGSLLAVDRPNDLIALHAEVSTKRPGNPLFSVPSNVAQYLAMVGIAHIRMGRAEAALDLLRQALVHHAGATDLVAAAVPEILTQGTDAASLVGIVAVDSTGRVATALASQVPAVTTASICLAALMVGEPHPPVVAIQLSAALIGGADDLAEAGLAFADVLEEGARERVAALARRKHRDGLADRLATAAGAARTA